MRVALSIAPVGVAILLNEALAHSSLGFPSPGLLLLVAVTASTLSGGWRGGLAVSIISILYLAYAFSSPGGWFQFSAFEWRRLIVFVAASIVNVLLVSALVRRSEATSKALADARLNRSEARFRALFQADIIGIFIAGTDGHILEANDEFLHMLGRTRESVEPEGYPRWDEITPAPYRAMYTAKIEELKRDGRCSPWRKQFIRSDGVLVPVLVGSVMFEPERSQALFFALDVSDVSHAEQKLQTLSGRLLRMQDDERRRIARELHDTTAQNLAALSMNLTMLADSNPEPARAQAILADCQELTTECLKEVRTLSYYLHPPLLDELGLESALRTYTETFTRRTGVRISLDIARKFGRYPTEVESALFRIAQESLTNVHQHSGSDRADVRARKNGNAIELTVRDYGSGIPVEHTDPDSPSVGIGIAGMRERARPLGGWIEIKRMDPGTLVRATIPGE